MLYLLMMGQVNQPIKFHRNAQLDSLITIHPGDYLIGDLNGVVCLPKELAEKAVRLMKSQVEADEEIVEDLKRGRGFEEASKERRAEVLRAEDL